MNNGGPGSVNHRASEPCSWNVEARPSVPIARGLSSRSAAQVWLPTTPSTSRRAALEVEDRPVGGGVEYARDRNR
jgi:hypothetical protein